MAKQIEINDIVTKVDTVKTKKLYSKKVSNILVANGDDLTIYLLAKKNEVIRTIFEKFAVNIECPYIYEKRIYFPVVGEIVSYGKNDYEEVDIYSEIFYKKIDFSLDKLNLKKVKVDFNKNNFFCSIHFLKDIPYLKHNDKIFYIALEEN